MDDRITRQSDRLSRAEPDFYERIIDLSKKRKKKRKKNRKETSVISLSFNSISFNSQQMQILCVFDEYNSLTVNDEYTRRARKVILKIINYNLLLELNFFFGGGGIKHSCKFWTFQNIFRLDLTSSFYVVSKYFLAVNVDYYY